MVRYDHATNMWDVTENGKFIGLFFDEKEAEAADAKATLEAKKPRNWEVLIAGQS